MTKILFLCHGNICRSVMAEFVMKYIVKQAGRSSEFEIDSAAVSREEIGNDMYPPAKQKLREKGIPFTCHAARQVTKADYDYYDYIILMDSSNARLLHCILGSYDFYEGAATLEGECATDSPIHHKVSLLMSWTDEGARNVADPWYTGDFETTYQDILKGCQAILTQL